MVDGMSLARARLRAALVVLPVLLWSAEALASGGEAGFSLKEHGFYIFNFVVFVGLLVYFGRKPIGVMLAARADSFRSRVEAARIHAEKAERELAEVREKMRTAETEKAGMARRLEAEGQALKETILKRAAEEQERIKASASATLESEKARMERMLQTELALDALDRAEGRLRQQWRTLPQAQYIREFVAAVNRPEGERK